MASEEKKLPPVIEKVVELIQEKKGKSIDVYYIGGISSFTDHMIICTAESSRQAQAISDHILSSLKDEKIKAKHVEGYNIAKWILMDYVDFLVNIFNPETRTFYALEKLWHDGELTKFDDIE